MPMANGGGGRCFVECRTVNPLNITYSTDLWVMSTKEAISSSLQNFSSLEHMSSYPANALGCNDPMILEISCLLAGVKTRSGVALALLELVELAVLLFSCTSIFVYCLFCNSGKELAKKGGLLFLMGLLFHALGF